MRSAFGFLIGTFVGGIFGATIAILLAPESGQDLRRHLRGRASGFADEIRGAAEQRRAELERHLEELRAPRG
ncbi:MAG: YtxH domain-containing protein [Anaerolineales bacterium]